MLNASFQPEAAVASLKRKRRLKSLCIYFRVKFKEYRILKLIETGSLAQ